MYKWAFIENCCWAAVALAIVAAAAWTGRMGFLWALLLPALAINMVTHKAAGNDQRRRERNEPET